MISSYHAFVLGIGLTTASLLPRVPLEKPPSPITLMSNPVWSSNAENASLQLSDPGVTYVCGGAYYGAGSHADSCDEALRTMALVPGSAMQQFTWGERFMDKYDVPLPQRWVSCQ